MTKREIAIAKAKVAGYENDTRTFTRLLVESRVRRELLNEAWHQGEKLRNIGTSQQVQRNCHTYKDILGSIPAEETDEEFARQVEDMR